MFGFMADCLVRATLLAAGVHGILLLLGIRSPRIKHLAWTAATLTMLTLPLLHTMDGSRLRIHVPVLSDAPQTLKEGLNTWGPTEPLAARVKDSGTALVASITLAGARLQSFAIPAYGLGALFLMVRLLWGMWQARRLVGKSFVERGVLVSPACASPVTVGWWQPRIVLPPESRGWPADQLRAVLAHEREHARWRDPLAQWCALLNRSIFWVHPVAWLMERHLSELAEDACDHAVLRQGHSAVTYSGFLLDCATALRKHGAPPHEFGMGIGQRGLARRIPRILSHASGAHSEKGYGSLLRNVVAALLCTGVAIGSAALSVQVVTIKAAAAAPARAVINPLPIVILTPVQTSITAVPAPMEQGAVLPPGPQQSASQRRLTEIYVDLAGMSGKDRTDAGRAIGEWLARLPKDDVNREVKIVVNTGDRTEMAPVLTADRGRLKDAIEALLANRSLLPSTTVQARMEAMESVVHELLNVPGERDLVCLLGAEAASGFVARVPVDSAGRPQSVRFIPSSLLSNRSN